MKTSVVCEGERYSAPLPFKAEDAPELPCNEPYAKLRFSKLRNKMLRDDKYQSDYVKFMQNIIDNGYAEPVPEEQSSSTKAEGWYLCHHGVYHPRKPGKIRVVFDASAQYGGTSLNAHLLTGPDLTNSLVGVLCRFRSDHCAVMCDIEQMFFQFLVSTEHRNFLKFLWFENSDVSQGKVVIQDEEPHFWSQLQPFSQ